MAKYNDQKYLEMEQRVVKVARYLIETKKTIREVGKDLKLSKSLVYRYVNEYLEFFHHDELAEQARAVLQYNKAQRHVRSGKAMKEKAKRRQGGVTDGNEKETGNAG